MFQLLNDKVLEILLAFSSDSNQTQAAFVCLYNSICGAALTDGTAALSSGA